MKPVIIEFPRDIPATAGSRAFVRGERYVVASPEIASRLYPQAVIVAFEDGAPYTEPGESSGSGPEREERRGRAQRRRA